MKFAAIALVATVSAISLQTEAEGKCVGWKESKSIFNSIDSNDNGQVGKHELVHALKAYAKSRDYTPTDKDWAWVKKTATKDAGKDHTLSQKEFHKWINQFARHFHIDGCKWAWIVFIIL